MTESSNKNVNGYFLRSGAHHYDATKSMVTMSNKRKGTATMASTSFSVAVTPYDTDEEWLDTRQKLKELRTFSMDNLISSFNSCVSLQQELQQEQTHIVQASQEIKNKLASRIELAREACKEESDDLYRMELTLEQLQADRHALIQSLEELESLQVETKDRILQYKEVASLYIEEIDQVEAERMEKVPRLKQQISLYATSTGIKWDFDQESLLAGQVVCSHYFSYDYCDCSLYSLFFCCKTGGSTERKHSSLQY